VIFFFRHGRAREFFSVALSLHHGRAFDPAIHFAASPIFGDVLNVSTAWMAGS
jgi:hypothetical protein